MKYLHALIIKEFLQIKRDPSTLLIAFVMPAILLFIFGYGVNLDNATIRLGIISEDQSTYATSLLDALTHSDNLEVSFYSDKRLCEALLTNGKIRGITLIPQEFSKNINAKKQLTSSILIVADGSEPNIASFAHNSVKGATMNWWQNQISSPKKPISINTRYWYNPDLKSRNFLVPGSIAIIMTIIGTLLTAMVVAREWERGTMEALLSTPISMIELLLGKLIPYFILGLISMLLCCLVATQLYDVPFEGSIVMLLIVSSLFLITALGQGLLISSVAKDQFLAAQMALMSAYLPAFMLSGFIFEIDAMPSLIRTLTHVFAARYLVTALHTIFLVGDIMPVLLKSCMMIIILGVVFYTLIIKKIHKRLY